jgi:hypothetical protein
MDSRLRGNDGSVGLFRAWVVIRGKYEVNLAVAVVFIA